MPVFRKLDARKKIIFATSDSVSIPSYNLKKDR